MAELPVSKLYPWSVYEQVVDKHSPFSMENGEWHLKTFVQLQIRPTRNLRILKSITPLKRPSTSISQITPDKVGGVNISD